MNASNFGKSTNPYFELVRAHPRALRVSPAVVSPTVLALIRGEMEPALACWLAIPPLITWLAPHARRNWHVSDELFPFGELTRAPSEYQYICRHSGSAVVTEKLRLF